MAKKSSNPPPERSTRVAADPTLWSDSSKRSYEYERVLRVGYYEDKKNSCRYCGTAIIFTAQEQKAAFEIHKVYVWQRRQLCAVCLSAKRHLQQEIKECESMWRKQHHTLRSDRSFLERWLDAVNKLPRYRSMAPDKAKIAMLQKLLEQIKTAKNS